MHDDVMIRLSHPGERDALLAFITRMGFNPRDATTWDALRMTAMTAWRGNQLLGAIPLEPRPFQIRPGLVVPIVHETVVAVDPSERSRGIGSHMQNAIAASPPLGATMATVFREEPDSPAYRWYVRNGFCPVMRIESWFRDEMAAARRIAQIHDPQRTAPDWAELAALWQSCMATRWGGFVDRAQRPLASWLTVHPYRNRYVFRLLCVREEGRLIGYVLVGAGRMHSETIRLDVLEAVAVNSDTLRNLMHDVLAMAAERGYRPVRWPIAKDDPAAMIARELRFEPRWSFDMLVRTLTPEIGGQLEPRHFGGWRYAGLDYI